MALAFHGRGRLMFRSWFARRPPDPGPEVSVRVLVERIHRAIDTSAVLVGARNVSPSVLRLDDVDWARIEGHLHTAGANRSLRDAYPRLAGCGRLVRLAYRAVSGAVLLLVRGLANRQGRFNDELLASCRGLAHRLQCCESVVVRQAARIEALEEELARLRRAA